MTEEESNAALKRLAGHPAARHVESGVREQAIVKRCTRCGGEDRFALPVPASFLRIPGMVPRDLDARLFAFQLAFLDAHVHADPDRAPTPTGR